MQMPGAGDDLVELSDCRAVVVRSIGDRIEHYTDGISIPPEGETLFRNNGKYVYAYYNRDEHKLMLINFQ